MKGRGRVKRRLLPPASPACLAQGCIAVPTTALYPLPASACYCLTCPLPPACLCLLLPHLPSTPCLPLPATASPTLYPLPAAACYCLTCLLLPPQDYIAANIRSAHDVYHCALEQHKLVADQDTRNRLKVLIDALQIFWPQPRGGGAE